MNTLNENPMDYSMLSDSAKRFIHYIELKECATTLSNLVGQPEAERILRSLVLHGLDVNAYQYELKSVFGQRLTATRRKEYHAFYYLVAGVGIKRITQYLKCGQALVYRVRDADHSERKSELDGMFQIFPQTIWNIQNIKRHLNVLNQHDATRSEWIPRQFPNWNR